MNQRVSSRHTWPGWLVIILLAIDGIAWAVLFVTALSGGEMPIWLPGWPSGAVVGVVVVLIVGAWGIFRFQPWGWFIALAYMAFGAVSLASQVLFNLTGGAVDRFLFLLPVLALLALPYMLRRRHDFFGGERSAPQGAV